MATCGATTRAAPALTPASRTAGISRRDRKASSASTVNSAQRANSSPSTGAGSTAPTATPARPPPTQYAWQVTCIASSRGPDRDAAGSAALTAYTSSISA
nr:hypothetical protein [Jiangella endophytica]